MFLFVFILRCLLLFFFFFFNDTATTEIYTLSLHDALPICAGPRRIHRQGVRHGARALAGDDQSTARQHRQGRLEEHTSELQSLAYLVCRLLLEKKKTKKNTICRERRNDDPRDLAKNAA